MLGVGVLADSGDPAIADREDGYFPLYAWSLIWLSQDRHPLLGTLLRRFAETGLRRRWLECDAARDWLPAHDQAELRRLEHLTARPGA